LQDCTFTSESSIDVGEQVDVYWGVPTCGVWLIKYQPTVNLSENKQFNSCVLDP
jgi:hypothetical protein